jgi:hypothetical protein
MTCTEPAHERWDYVVEILKTFRELDIEDELYWHFHATPYNPHKPVYVDYPTFWLLCSDTFGWGVADGEDILPEDLPLLKDTIADLKEIGSNYWEGYISPLFAARKRKQQPMFLWMERLRRGDYHSPDRRTQEQIDEWNDQYGETHAKIHELFLAVTESTVEAD